MTKNEIIQKIEDLRTSISYTYFKDFLDNEDYKRIDIWEKEIKRLESELDGNMICALIERGNSSFYLTHDKNLCCGQEPSWFENIHEAEEQLKLADIKNISGIRFMRKRDFKNGQTGLGDKGR